MITEPLYRCAKVVNVRGYVPQATIDLEVNGAIDVSGFPGGSPAPFGVTIPLSAALDVGWAVRARQNHGGATSPWSATIKVRDHTADYPAGPPRPELFPAPLYKCGVRTGVGNLLVGCNVRITSDGTTVGAVDGANDPQGGNISPAYDTGKHVRGWAELCNDPSPPSLEQIVQPPPPPPLPTPGFDPYYATATDLAVNTIPIGAQC